MESKDGEREEELRGLYERYGRPLEGDHWGEFIAISPRGDWLTGTDLLEVGREAAERFGNGNYVCKIGEIAVGKIR